MLDYRHTTLSNLLYIRRLCAKHSKRFFEKSGAPIAVYFAITANSVYLCKA